MNPSDFEILRDLLPDYVLGLLSAEETRSVESALGDSAELREELSLYETILGDLAVAVPQIDPSPALGEQLLRRIQPPLKLEGSPPPSAIYWRSYALAAVMVVVLMLVGTVVLSQLQPADPMQKILEHQDTHARPLTGSESQPTLSGEFMWNETLGQGVLKLENLAPLPADQAYQVWFVKSENERLSAKVFQSKADSTQIMLDLPPNFWQTYQLVGMTVEPRAGSEAPTSPPVFLVSIND